MEKAEILSNNSNSFVPQMPRRITLDDCSADWLNSLEGKTKKSTFDTYRRIYKRNISPVLGKKICEEITQSSAESVLESPGINSGNYRSMVATVLKMVIDYANENGHKTGADMRGKTSPTGTAAAVEFLDENEFKRLNDTVLRDINLEKAIVFLGMNTGLKCGELSALKRSDIDFKTRKLSVTKGMQRIYLNETDGKTGGIVLELNDSAKREIELPKFVTDTVKPLYKGFEEDFYLTTGRRDYVLPSTLNIWLKNIGAECGLNNLNYTALRHTFAKRCAKVGIDAVDLAGILGIGDVSRVVRLYYGGKKGGGGRLLERLNSI